MKGANYEPMQVNKVGTCRETVRWNTTITDSDALSNTDIYCCENILRVVNWVCRWSRGVEV